jgi:hypothetical protein
VHHVLETIHRTIASLERIAKPFDRECQLVSQQVERMYVGFQYQDRITDDGLAVRRHAAPAAVLAARPRHNRARTGRLMAQRNHGMPWRRSSAHAGAISAQAGDQEADFFERMIDGADDSRIDDPQACGRS